MTHKINIQNLPEKKTLPTRAQMRAWARIALKNWPTDTELTLRLVNEEEIQTLNKSFRKKNTPTNVLSFPMEEPDYLGDIALCEKVITREAKEQKKKIIAHWAHMVIHSVLHLQGYDHMKTKDAQKMEALEIALLDQLKFPSPY